jgi:tyrosyl-DNA phosphodiesterase 2
MRIKDTIKVLQPVRYSLKRDRWIYIPQNSELITPPPSSFGVITWNVQWDAQWPIRRLTRALSHIQRVVLDCESDEQPEPCCILLQEVHVNAFEVLLMSEWVQENFVVVPASPNKWPNRAMYGNVTLVSRTLPTLRTRQIEFGMTQMNRTALYVDLQLSTPGPETETVIFRVCNTHLESMPYGAPARKDQLGLVSQFLKDEEAELHGGLVAGDMNAVSHSDETLPRIVGLADAWKGKGKEKEGSVDSDSTLGQQPDIEFARVRTDKILYVASSRYRVEEPRVICQGVKLEDSFVSDHSGLMVRVHLLESD